VARLPKTRSGKILRKLLRQIAENKEFVVPSTIDDPASIDEPRHPLPSFTPIAICHLA
jgi:propionyl-CoA synthetase